MNFRSLFAVAAIAAAAVPAHADTIAGWDFETTTVSGTATTTLPAISASTGAGTVSGTHASASVFSTPAGNGSTKSLSSTLWAVGDYWQFNISTAGYTGIGLTFDQGSSGTGPRDFTVAYSTNGTTFTNFASYSLPSTNFSAGTVNSIYTQTFDLSTVAALNNASSVTIRLIDASTVSASGGSVGTGGTDRIDNVIFSGTVAAVPEPETYALMFAGLGVVGFMAKRRKA